MFWHTTSCTTGKHSSKDLSMQLIKNYSDLDMAPQSACVTSLGCGLHQDVGRIAQYVFYMGRQYHHIGVTTIKELYQSSFRPLLKLPRQTCLGRGLNPWPPEPQTRTLAKSYLYRLLITIQNMRPLQCIGLSIFLSLSFVWCESSL